MVVTYTPSGKEIIRYLKKEVKRSISSISREYGVHKETMKNWHSGKTSPSYYHLTGVTEMLGYDLVDVIIELRYRKALKEQP